MSVPLSDTQKQAFALLGVYRILTPSILTARVCAGSESVAKKLIIRSRDYIVSEPLGQKSVYYRLNASGAKLYGLPEEIAKPLGSQALPKALGNLDFCCGGQTHRQKYIRTEFIKDFPELASGLLGKDYHTDFFLDFDEKHARLGQIVVDLGGDYRKLLSKCRVRLREYLDVAHIRDIVAEGLFTFAIVVAEEEKAEAIRLAVNEKPLRARVIVETSAELKKCPIQFSLGGGE